MQLIRQWLNGPRHYHTGIALFNAHSEDSILKNMFEQGESPYRKDRLTEELRRILRECKTIDVPATVNDKDSKIVIIKETSQLLPELRIISEKDPYRDKWMPPYQEMNYLRHTLADAPNDTERGKMAMRILELEQDCTFWWDRAAEYEKNGKLYTEPEKEQIVLEDKEQLRKLLMNIRSNISKKKKKLEKNPNEPKALAALQELEEQKKIVEQKLGIWG